MTRTSLWRTKVTVRYCLAGLDLSCPKGVWARDSSCWTLSALCVREDEGVQVNERCIFEIVLLSISVGLSVPF
jgi:hypothetical protein